MTILRMVLCVAFAALSCAAQRDVDHSAVWLVRQQRDDGSWTGPSPLCATAVAVLGVLGEGRSSHLRKGVHRDALYAGVDWIRAAQDPRGRFAFRREDAWAFDQALAMFALCEAARLSIEPGGSRAGVDGCEALIQVLGREDLQVPPEALAFAALYCRSARRLDQRMLKILEQHEGWRETLDAQPPWAQAADRLQASIGARRALFRSPLAARGQAALLLVDTLLVDALSVERDGKGLSASRVASLQRDFVAAVARDGDVDSLTALFLVMAADVHLPASSEAFEEAWWQLERRLTPRVTALRVDEGEARGSWPPGSGSAELGAVGATAVWRCVLQVMTDCRSRAPRAWTSSLQSALIGVDRVVVTERAYKEPASSTEKSQPNPSLRPLLDLREPGALGAFVRRIEIDGVSSQRGLVCGCGGGPFLNFYRRGARVAVLGVHHGRALRWSEWSGDGFLTDSAKDHLIEWLAAHGVEGPRREVEESVLRGRERRRNEARWFGAMPNSLRPFWDRTRSGDPSSSVREAMVAAFAAEYPEPGARIVKLLQWFAAGSVKWIRHPSYELIPVKMLDPYTTTQILSALEAAEMPGQELSDRELCGVARFFAAWEYSQRGAADRAQLSAEWKQRLLDVVERSALGRYAERRARDAFGRDE